MSTINVSPTILPSLTSVLNIDQQLNTLQQQLGSGQKSQNYAGLGSQGGIAIALNAQLAAMNSYDETITNVGTTVSLQQSVLQQISSIASNVQSAAAQGQQFSIDGTGQTSTQESAQTELDQILSLLNSQGGNGYMFSGNALNQASVDTTDHILNGNGAAAGLKQVISERNQADLGSNGLGRLVIPAVSGNTVSVSEDAANSPYGLKLAAVNSTLTGATVSGPSGSPSSISVDLGSNPNNGDSITYTFDLPDGSTQTLQLQATTASPPGTNQFTIGATPAATAQNLQAALTAGVQQIGGTSLSAASAMAASNDFFDDPPQRVNGPPFDSATSQVAGTPSNTVYWYTGGNTTGSIRATQTARIDGSTTVSYGTQANEQGIRSIIQSIATLAATSYSSSDSNASASYTALNQRVYSALAGSSGTQSISDIETSLANAQTAMQSAQTQHQDTSNTLTNFLQSIEGVNTTEVGAQILSLQTALSASLETTARLSQINLVSYLAPVTG